MAAGEFVDGWLVAQVLGEGSYGEVRLLVHSTSGACVALKAVSAAKEGAREAALHRALRHRHVLRCLGERAHLASTTHYLFLEYAQGGELFDRIEPDVGMPTSMAKRYWRQLLDGLRYLHSRGVAHRDIKPENLLLDHEDDLKISDFGMATLFRHESRERLLSRVCGTLPYAAPEVLTAATRPYRAVPADLWAAALVLLAMLAGELPWERASNDDARFASWRSWCVAEDASCTSPSGVWRKLRASPLRLLRRALHPSASKRATIDELLSDVWIKESATPISNGVARVWASQPARGARDCTDGDDGEPELRPEDMDALISHSQPAHADDLLLDTQENTQHTASGGRASVFARVVRRLSRVWMRCGEAEALAALQEALKKLRYDYRRIDKRTLAIECGDELRMRAWVWRAGCVSGESGEGDVVVEFRRSRGCGLEFKRRFVQLRDALQPLAAQPQPPLADLLAPLRTTRDAPQPMDQE